jgi:uncharacterized protein involved in cysteine biosynthesis
MHKATPLRVAGTAALVVLSYVVAAVGRWLLDIAIASAPSWASVLERVGGWLVGLVVVVVVLLPMFRLWGAFAPKREANRP